MASGVSLRPACLQTADQAHAADGGQDAPRLIRRVRRTIMPRCLHGIAGWRNRLCRQGPERREASRPPRRAAYEVRVRHQPRSRQGDRSDNPAVRAGSHQRHHPVTGRTNIRLVPSALHILTLPTATGVELRGAPYRGSRCSPRPVTASVDVTETTRCPGFGEMPGSTLGLDSISRRPSRLAGSASRSRPQRHAGARSAAIGGVIAKMLVPAAMAEQGASQVARKLGCTVAPAFRRATSWNSRRRARSPRSSRAPLRRSRTSTA